MNLETEYFSDQAEGLNERISLHKVPLRARADQGIHGIWSMCMRSMSGGLGIPRLIVLPPAADSLQ